MLLYVAIEKIAGTSSGGGGVDVHMLAGIGNSIMNGLGQGSMVAYAANTLGVPFYISSHSGHRTQYIKTFIPAVIAAEPTDCVIEGGVNDVNTGDPESMTVGNYVEMVDALVVADIRPYIVLILPWTNGTNAQNQKIDSINAQLIGLTTSYPTLKIIDSRSKLGKFRVGGPPGNYWDIKDIYDVDGVHMNAAAYQILGADIVSATQEGASPVPSYLLMEDGSFIILETGDKIILE